MKLLSSFLGLPYDAKLNVICSLTNGNIGNYNFALGFNAQNDNIDSILDKIKIFINNFRTADTIYM